VFGGFLGFIGVAIGLVLLILIWPKIPVAMAVVRGTVLTFSIVLIANFVLSLYLARHPTSGMKSASYAAAADARKERAEKECNDAVSAFSAATIEVKRRLKDSDSAVFPWPNDPEVRVQKVGGACTFKISANVRAKNDFGAYVPSPFDATVRYDMTRGAWVLEAIQI
jgi:hypothetical protein